LTGTCKEGGKTGRGDNEKRKNPTGSRGPDGQKQQILSLAGGEWVRELSGHRQREWFREPTR